VEDAWACWAVGRRQPDGHPRSWRGRHPRWCGSVHPLWFGVIHPRLCRQQFPLVGVVGHDGRERSYGCNVLLLVGRQGRDELSKGDKEVHGGGDGLVLFADGLERSVGRIQAVRAADSVSSCYRDVKLEEVMVVRRATNCVCLVTVGRKRVARVGGDVHHTLVAKGRHGCSVPIERTFYFFVRREIVVIS